MGEDAAQERKPEESAKAALARTLPAEALTPSGAREHLLRTVATEVAGAGPVEEAAPGLRGEALDERLRQAGLAPVDGEGAPGRYELQAMLGAGATGRVFAARDRNLGREVAVKVLARPAGKDPAGVAAFIAEARVTASLAHPGILPVHEIDVTAQGQPYFTMAKVAGRTLGEVANDSTPEERDARIRSFNAVVSIFIAVGHAVAYAHHRGIVHQDIKPDNILLGDFGEVLLLDWGSATRWPGAGSAHLYGTPIYMSPEQARREGSTPSSDVYCLGASLFHVLTLRYPTWSDDVDVFWERKRRGAIDALTAEERRRAPAPLLDIALKAMAVEPSERYASVDDFVADLESWQSGQAVKAHREAWYLAVARWYRRNARVVQVSAVALLAVALIAGALWREKLKEREAWRLVWEDDLAQPRPERIAESWDLISKPHFGMGTWRSLPIAAGENLDLGPGGLTLKSDHWMENLVFKRRFIGNVRVEWDYESTQYSSNLNCFIGPNREEGFTFHIASWGDSSYMVLTKGTDYRIVDTRIATRPFEINHVYHFVMERRDRHARLAIDGEPVLDYMELENELPQQFGFDCYAYSRLRIANLRIYDQPLPQKVSPLAVAGKVYQLGNYAEAERQYQQVISAYPDTDMARDAFFWLGVCAIRQGDAQRGLGILADFESMNPRHELVPFSLHERLVQAVAAGDRAREDRIRDALGAYAGSPIVCTVVRELGEARLALLARRPQHAATDDPYPADIESRIVAAIAEIKRWSERYRTPWQANPFMHEAAEALISLGRSDLVLTEYPPGGREYADALYDSGQFDRVLALPSNQFAVRGGAARDRLSPEEAEKASPKDVDNNWRLYVTGRHDELLAQGNSEWRDMVMLARGRAEEVLVRWPSTPRENSFDWSMRMRCFAALGRHEQILEESTSHIVRAEALIALGRLDEALAEVPDNEDIAARVALTRLAAGDRRGAEQLRALARIHTDFKNDRTMVTHHLVPILLDALDGDGGAARDRLAALAERYPLTYRQQLRYLCDRILGRIDDAAFRLQPFRWGLDTRLALAKAIAAELAGDPATALACYRDYQAVPYWRSDRREAEALFVAWRIHDLGAQRP